MSVKYYFYLALIYLIIFKVNIISTLGRIYTSDKNNQYYIQNDQKYKWVEALASCREMNMSLLTIDNETKSREINRLVQDTFQKRLSLWVGGIRSRHPNQHFIWLETAKPFTYTYWEGHNPDFSGDNEYCVQIGWGNKMEWNDKACGYELGFICEPNQQHLEKQILQQQFQQEIEKQQNLQIQVQVQEKREQILLQELESLKKDLKQKEKHLAKNQQQLEEMKNKTQPNISLHFHQDRYN